MVIIRLARTTICLCDWVLVVGILFRYSDSNLLNRFTKDLFAGLFSDFFRRKTVCRWRPSSLIIFLCVSKSLNQLGPLNRFVKKH